MFGRETPTIRAMPGDQAPAAFTTVRVTRVRAGCQCDFGAPRAGSTSTPTMRLPSVRSPVTRVNGRTVAPCFTAPCAKPQTNGQGKTTPSFPL